MGKSRNTSKADNASSLGPWCRWSDKIDFYAVLIQRRQPIGMSSSQPSHGEIRSRVPDGIEGVEHESVDCKHDLA